MADSSNTATVHIDGETLRLEDVRAVAEQGASCAIPDPVLDRVTSNRETLDRLVRSRTPVYGVTTGFGEMVNFLISPDRETELQTNLVRSHSCGVGDLFSATESRAILCSRLNSLLRGYSAVRPELVRQMMLYLDEDIVPAIPEVGSLGASGDLPPLAHAAVTLIGEGYVLGADGPVETSRVLHERDIAPLRLRFKEGLALINGTSAMTGLGSLLVCRALDQVRQAETISALVLEALRASATPLAAEGHELARPHRGQIDSAAHMRALTAGSAALRSESELREMARCASTGHSGDTGVERTDVFLQQAYSLRAVPQVLGAVRDALAHAEHVLRTELNSANDNPLLFEHGQVFHGANFHGQSVALVMDHACLALTQLGVLAERTVNRLLNRHLNGGLPGFLVGGEPGLSSGLAGSQYSATALVAENRTIGPASIQSIPANGDNQDVVSMGLTAARNARRVSRNNDRILAVEAVAAAQAVDAAERYDQLSPAGRRTYDRIRGLVSTLSADRFMSTDLEHMANALGSGALLDLPGD
ncbi:MULTISPECIES: tyrosine 2,3-aminomutase [unclassified Actinopolyspora]|uniref:tyrosine 2,3-aminomutase n=1 Tax=unclassified Actinopolyspora TaxID=2639451 RepID=UPI0013F5B5F9|nr:MULTISPECIES: tyrosine 2,3-aminomutase [unclassified Actinopolyspora]NHD19432.1 tyrosine 2,3-aminomutase [Actinopolyspora sp. BKK2]NHE78495.1 tyrosine 2,3-aminomutase [Actinopolyspora sp. BKK1]